MSELKLPEPLMVNKNVTRVLDKLEENGETIFAFSGEKNIEILFELYLIKKYKSKCLASDIGGKNYTTFQKQTGITIYLKKRNTKTEAEEMNSNFKRIAKKLVECVKKGETIIFIPLTYTKGKSSHANVLIYRRNLGQLEHFEPHGGTFRSDQSVQESAKRFMQMLTNILNTELKNNNLPQVNYIEASQVCPYILGLQILEGRSTLKKSKIEPAGYCSAWSMFFSELCLKNPEMSSSEIMDNIYNYLTTKPSAEDYLKKVIRGYAGYIFETVNKYLEIFFKPKLTVVDVLNITRSRDLSRLIILNDAIHVLVSIETEALLDPNFNLEKELRETKKKYREITRGMTKQEMRNERLRDNSFAFLYYKKRILQNYEEYTNYGKITEPLLVSPMEIREEDIVNPTIINRRNPDEILPNHSKSKKALNIKKTSNSKTRKSK